MFAYSNNGLAFRALHDAGDIVAGEVFFDHKPSAGDLAAAFPGYTAAVAVQQGQAAFFAALLAGCQIVSTGTPALNATYRIDQAQQQTIAGIATGIAARNRVPGGGADFNYPDIDGNLHAFTATNFLDFASAVEDYVYALSNGGSPAQPVTIA
jgi:hypothetical protein